MNTTISFGPSCGLVARSLLRNAFPFWETVRSYTWKTARADMLAAVTVAIVASPQSMAYAVIAGVDPVYGLYASMLPVIVAALWGSSRYLLAGPTNAISMILYSTMAQLTVAGVAVASLPPEQRMGYLFALAVLVGVIQLGMGLARLGELANFISHSVIQAFTVGASILIALGQMRTLLGLHFPAPLGAWDQLRATVEHLPETNVYSLGIGLYTLAAALLIKRLRPKWPNALIALISAACLAALFDLGGYGVALAGAIPRGLPPLTLPFGFSLDDWNALFLPALSVALLGTVETLAIARTMASQEGDSLDGSQELIGQGLGNIAAGLTSGIAGCGSFGRSAVNYTAGAKTRFAAAFSGLLTMAALLALGPMVRYIPIPCLAALLLLICWNMINVAEIRFTLRATRSDCLVWTVTVASVLILDLEKAVFIGVLLSLGLFLRREAHPRVQPMGRHMLAMDEEWLAPCPYVAAFRLEGPLFFGAVSEVENSLSRYEEACHQLIILHMNRVHLMDATGAHALRAFLRRCGQRGVKVIICWSHPDVRDTIVRTGLSRGKNGCYLTGNMEGAALLTTTLLLESCACQACMGCEHGRNAVAEIQPGQALPECSAPILRPEYDLPSPALDDPAPGADSLEKPESPTALLERPASRPAKTAETACPLPAPQAELPRSDQA